MAAAARPCWTGFLKLSLVTIAVRRYSATTEKERIHFHRIHEPSGERVRYQNVVPGLGPVDHYQGALKELIDEKLAGRLPERPPERKPAQVINLMDALKRSLAEEWADKTGEKVRPRSAKSSKAQPSLLLPVRGGLADKPKAQPAEAPKRRKKAS